MRKAMTVEERHKIAEEISSTIVIRDYVRGNSRDTRRETTGDEKNILYNVALAALNSLNYTAADERDVYNTKTHAILNTAEFMFMEFIADILPLDDGTYVNSDEVHANSYDSIYIPLANVIRKWEWEEE